jgi:SAM-dependent methyltransferase
MSASRPDPDSLRYSRYWEPVLAGPALRMIDRIQDAPNDYLDIGAGTGSLTLAAAERWPAARIISLDASNGMLSVAQHRVATERAADDAARFEWLAADAAAIPLEDASVDVVTSSFMIQLVDDRAEVLREVRRVLRPGGVFGMVTWIAGELVLAADDAFLAVVDALGLEVADDEPRPSRTTDFVHVEEAHAELVVAGFSAVDAQADLLRYAWTRDTYLDFKQQYDDHDLFDALDPSDQARLSDAVRTCFAALPDDAFMIGGPLVSAIARRPSE